MTTKTTSVVRQRLKRDREWMDRARRRYIKLRSAWLEEDHERVYDLVKRMWDLGLYVKSGECPSRCSIIRNLAAWRDHVNIYDHDSFRLWLMKSGWSGQYGWWNSKKARAKARRTA